MEKKNKEIELPLHSHSAELVWHDLEVITDKKKVLLDNVSGKIEPGTMVALMGSSGAGKSTLMNVLTGRQDSNLTVEGNIYVNSKRLNKINFKQIAGYVQQVFHAYPNQTVLETLKFAYHTKCRKKYNFKKSMIEIREYLRFLGLIHRRDTYVKSLSGGERMRLSVGVELLSDPSILFLDEPLSGLDSYNANKILQLCQKLAKEQNKTIIMTIHQPSYKMMKYFDKMHLLAASGVVYDGPIDGCTAFFEECGEKLPENTNPADFFLDCISIDYTTNKTAARSMDKVIKYKNHFETKDIDVDCTSKMKIVTKDYNEGILRGFLTCMALINRLILNKVRDVLQVSVKFAQLFLMFAGTITFFVLVLRNNMLNVMSFLVVIGYFIISELYLFSTNIFMSFDSERLIFTREIRSGMYGPFMLYFTKFLTEYMQVVLLDLPVHIILFSISKLITGIDGFLHLLVLYLIIMFVSTNSVLGIAILTTNIDITQMLNLIVFGFYACCSGVFFVYNTVDSFLWKIAKFSPIYYLLNSFLDFHIVPKSFTIKNTYNTNSVTGVEIMREIAFKRSSVFVSFLIPFIHPLIFIMIGCFCLWRQTRVKHFKIKNKK